MQKHMVALAQFFCPVLIVLSMSKCPSEIVWSNDPSPQASAYHTSQPPMIMFQWPCGFKIQIDRIWSNNLWAHFLALAFALFLGGAVLASAGRFSSFCLRVRFGLRFWRRLQCPAGNSAENEDGGLELGTLSLQDCESRKQTCNGASLCSTHGSSCNPSYCNPRTTHEVAFFALPCAQVMWGHFGKQS